MNTPLAFTPVTQLLAALRRGELSATRLLTHYRDRIDRLGTKSRAFISLDLDGAAARAAAFDSGGQGRQPLGGVPYTVKDLFDVAGMVTTGGSRVLADNVANRDAASVERMNAAGAILLGKNNLHEFAYGATGENEIYGTPPNPYDPARLAGGSSSGSAAALAYGLCAAALGTDTGGSVRAPAALCGLVGFKPTFGRISTEGVIPYSWSLDHVGTLTRSAADAALLFETLATAHQAAAAGALERLSIGIPQTFFYEHCDEEILDSLERLKTFLRESGVKLLPVQLPSMEYTRSVSLTVQMPEALSYHNRFLQQRGNAYSADFRAGLALGQCLLAEQYIRARRFIESYRRDMAQVFTSVDLILTPATPLVAPEIGAVEVSVGGRTEPAGNAITRYTSFFNMTGHPALTLPCGMHSTGLPIAAQLIGRHHADESLLASAAALESAYDFELPLPDLG